MSRVAAALDLPVATNMCTLDLDEIPQTIRLGAIDVMLLDPCDWGGVGAFQRAAAAFQIFQVGIGMHSGGEAGISTALQVQLAAALPVLPYAIDSHYHHQTEDVITEPWQYADGCFRLPDGPGLGVEIDEDQLEARAPERRRGRPSLLRSRGSAAAPLYGHVVIGGLDGPLRRLLAVVCLVQIADFSLVQVITPLLPYYADRFGFEQSESGHLVAAFAAGALVSAIPAGMLCSRVGVKATVVGGLLLMGLRASRSGLPTPSSGSRPPASARAWRAPRHGPARSPGWWVQRRGSDGQGCSESSSASE